MTYNKSVLYNLSNQRVLLYHLKIKSKDFLKQDFVAQLVRPYIETKQISIKSPPYVKNKERIIEVPSEELKAIQKKLKKILSKLDYPEYVFSGVKGRSYPDNARLHAGNKYLYKIDITAFFPSISREKVFHFFINKFGVSTDIAEKLANFTTIDLDKASIDNPQKVNAFLKDKGINTRNHLISGSPASQLLSYLVNQDMFDQLHALSKRNGITMSIYVDDITFSAENYISARFKTMIKKIGTPLV